jgi:hypothetical protein
MVEAFFFTRMFQIPSSFLRRGDASARFGYLAILAILSSFTPARGQAAPIILKELSYSDGGTQFSPPPLSLPFDFRIYEPNIFPTPVYVSWIENYSSADVGISFYAPPEIVAGASAARVSATALSLLEIVGSGAFHSTEPWSPGFPSGYYITAIERVIDNLVITPIHETRYTVQFAHRVRIWGEPIPEPRTVGLSTIGIAVYAIPFRRRNARVTIHRAN